MKWNNVKLIQRKSNALIPRWHSNGRHLIEKEFYPPTTIPTPIHSDNSNETHKNKIFLIISALATKYARQRRDWCSVSHNGPTDFSTNPSSAHGQLALKILCWFHSLEFLSRSEERCYWKENSHLNKKRARGHLLQLYHIEMSLNSDTVLFALLLK